jgi:hypothetical protein
MKVIKKKTILLYFWLSTWTMYTSLANFLKIWSNCGYWKSPKKKLVLSTFYFSISHSGYIYIYCHRKKNGIGSFVVNNPPTRAVAGNGPTRAVAGNGPARAVARNGPTCAVAGNGPTRAVAMVPLALSRAMVPPAP